MAFTTKDYSATKHAGLKIHKDGSTFLFDVMLDGKRYRQVYKSKQNHVPKDKMLTAQDALRNFIKEIKHNKSITANPNATINDYYTNLKEQVKWNENTLKKYDLYYNKYIRGLSIKEDGTLTTEDKSSFGNMKIKDVKPQHFTAYNKTIRHLSLSRQKKSYELLKPLFELAIEDEIILKTPIKKIHIPKRDQQAEKKIIVRATEKYKAIYSSINQLFNSTDTVVISDTKVIQCSVNSHHLAIFLFGFHGRRLNEVLTLQWDDIDFINNQYRIKKEVSKIKQDMIFTLPSDVKDALLTFQDTTGNVFAVEHIIRHYKYIRMISGLHEFTFHWMRNLAVSALSSAGVPTADLSAMLGHSDINTLNKYLSLQRGVATVNTNATATRLLS